MQTTTTTRDVILDLLVEAADAHGMLLWQDLPLQWGYARGTRKQAVRQAREAGFSPSQFRRIFHQHVGTAPRDYLVAKRMEMACHYLEYTTLSLRHIAAKIGIHNVPHFSRAFKKNLRHDAFAVPGFSQHS